jgi:hypothetical protein
VNSIDSLIDLMCRVQLTLVIRSTSQAVSRITSTLELIRPPQQQPSVVETLQHGPNAFFNVDSALASDLLRVGVADTL